METRKCKVCQDVKELTVANWNMAGGYFLQTCRECRNAQHRAAYKKAGPRPYKPRKNYDSSYQKRRSELAGPGIERPKLVDGRKCDDCNAKLSGKDIPPQFTGDIRSIRVCAGCRGRRRSIDQNDTGFTPFYDTHDLGVDICGMV